MADERKILSHPPAPKSQLLKSQFWFIAKNVIGWLLMLSAMPIGVALPGPGGIPIFLVGFALATIPGKRRMTSHVMRGRPVRVNSRLFAGIVSFISVVACVAIVWYFSHRFREIVDWVNLTRDERGRYFSAVAGLCVCAVAVSWLGTKLGVVGMNFMFRTLPKARRMARPWLKKYGVALLPPRRKLVDHTGAHVNENEILHFSEHSTQRFKTTGLWLLQWGRRALVLAVMLWIFFKILKPIFSQWGETRARLAEMTSLDLAVSVLMFAVFLAAIRAMSWRSILVGFGSPIPRRGALRVWILSELSRYLPGAIWQVVSRVRLVKPYGIRGSVTSTSQVLELSIFLLANVCLATCCLLFLGFKHVRGDARYWLFVSMFLVPLLSLLLHPRVFYGLTDRILARLGKPAIANRLSMTHLMKLFAVAVIGLLWQSLALWILLHGPLGIGIRDWWILAGAYCLAWTAGFLAFLSPGGLGVREIVLIGALHFALPAHVRDSVGEKSTLAALAMISRLWTIAAEIIVAAFALVWDVQGIGRRGAKLERSPVTDELRPISD